VGHEIRNPLGVMRNIAYYLRSVFPDAPPKVRHHIDTLEAQISLTEKIVSDILGFSRNPVPERSAVPVAEFVGEQLGRVSPPPDVWLVPDVDRGLPPMFVDRVQIGQIVLNLLTNAIQAVGDRGVIVIRARATEGRIRLEVEDDGPGVRDEDAERIFEPLFTTKERGFGLGLAVSRVLARANGGELGVARAASGGAIFGVDLPAAVEFELTARIEPTPAPDVDAALRAD
jgi:signal transduction histidine kinase